MSILYRAYKYRIYPNQKQKVALAKTFGCCRKIYNLMLSETNDFYKKTGKLPQLTIEKYFTDHPYLMEVDRSALYCEKFHLADAFRYYFNIEGRGYPKFKSYKSFRKSIRPKVIEKMSKSWIRAFFCRSSDWSKQKSISSYQTWHI